MKWIILCLIFTVFGCIILHTNASCNTTLQRCRNCDTDSTGGCKRTQQVNSESDCISFMVSNSMVIYTPPLVLQSNCLLDECANPMIKTSLTNSTTYRYGCNRVCNNITVMPYINAHVINAVPEVIFTAAERKVCLNYCIESALDGISCAGVYRNLPQECTIYMYTSCSAQVFQQELLGSSTIDYVTCDVTLPPRCCSLPLPQNGDVTYTGLNIGDIATYSCNSGFILSLNDTRTCLNNLTWSGNQPSCVAEVSCEPPVNIPNGSFTLTAPLTVTYTCDIGFTIWGPTEITCGANGHWPNVPTCNITDCGFPAIIPNGVINVTSTLYQGSVIYTCDVGFTMNGSSIRQCATDGNWTLAPPTCNIVDCGTPSPIENGFVNINNTTYQETANYSCNTGYAIGGHSSRICQENGTWSEPLPNCIVDCGNPPAITLNGSVAHNDTLLDSVATYMCDNGCEMIGTNQTTCLSNGSWSNIAPNCSCSIPCEALSNPVNGYVNILNDTNNVIMATFSCISGYVLYGNPNITCTPAGLWSSEPPTCRLRVSDLTPIYLLPCFCKTGESTFSNMTQDEIVEQLIKDTKIDVTKTTKALQKLQSTDDPRQSSQVIGTVGILFISIILGFIVVIDFVSLVHECWSRYNNARDRVRRFSCIDK